MEELYVDVPRPAPPDRPWVAVNMVAGLDGATVVKGTSRGLSSDLDRAVFRALRGAADAVLVGAGTARTEGYGPVRLDDEVRARRTAAGKPPTPRLVVVTRSVNLDMAGAMFTEADPAVPTTVLAPGDADADRLRGARAAGEVVLAGSGTVDLNVGLAKLGEMGIEFVLCEGGPTLNADLAEAGCIDELDLTIAPLAVGGFAKRILDTADLDTPLDFDLAHCILEDNQVFLRAVRPG